MVSILGNPLFLLQIVDASRRVVACVPGGGELETDLIEHCVRTILAKGVGIGRTSAHVEQDIRDGIREALQSLKDQTRFLV